MHGPMNDPVRDLLTMVETQAARSGYDRGVQRSSACAFWRGVACGIAGALVMIAWWAV